MAKEDLLQRCVSSQWIKDTGRQYEFFRFDNEQSIPFDEKADTGNRIVHDSDYINDVKAYQTQQKDKNGNYAEDDDELTR